MDDHTLWNLAGEAEDAIVSHYEPVFTRFSADSGLDVPTVGLLLAAITFEPDTTTPARLRVRGPYTATQTYLARLAAATETGYMTEGSSGEYRLNDPGRVSLQRLIEETRAVMAQADPLPLADSQRLASLLDQLVRASLSTPPPPDTWSIRLSYKLMPAVSPPLPYIEQAISCLRGYRDDAHLAAWRPSDLSAAALETLTLLWRGEADSLAAVCQRLSRRGHSPDVYAEALRELHTRDFIEGPETVPRLTEAGRAFREQVERDTDHFFFAPWACLDEAQRVALAELLTRLRDGLREGRP